MLGFHKRISTKIPQISGPVRILIEQNHERWRKKSYQIYVTISGALSN